MCALDRSCSTCFFKQFLCMRSSASRVAHQSDHMHARRSSGRLMVDAPRGGLARDIHNKATPQPQTRFTARNIKRVHVQQNRSSSLCNTWECNSPSTSCLSAQSYPMMLMITGICICWCLFVAGVKLPFCARICRSAGARVVFVRVVLCNFSGDACKMVHCFVFSCI